MMKLTTRDERVLYLRNGDTVRAVVGDAGGTGTLLVCDGMQWHVLESPEEVARLVWGLSPTNQAVGPEPTQPTE